MYMYKCIYFCGYNSKIKNIYLCFNDIQCYSYIFFVNPYIHVWKTGKKKCKIEEIYIYAFPTDYNVA